MNEDFITLYDENNQPVEFEIMDILEYHGEEFVVLYPADEEGDDAPVQIYRVAAEDLDSEEVSYEGIEDTELLETIYQLFRKRNGL